MTLSLSCFLLAAFVSPARSQPTTIALEGGSCSVKSLDLKPMWGPAGMKPDEKAFTVSFKCALDKGFDKKALGALYDKGSFKDATGKTYKPSAASINESELIYNLSVAVPQNVDVEALAFVFEKTTTSSLKVETEKK